MIKVVGKALDIIEKLAVDPQKEYPLGQIADSLGMDHGTCSNIIHSLLSRGYVMQDGPRHGYKLGYMFYKITGSSVANDELTKLSREVVDSLGAQLNESVILSVIRNDRRIVLHHTVPDRNIIVRTNTDKSVYATNTGRVIIANYTPRHLEKFVVRCGLPTAAEWPEVASASNPAGELMNRLAEIRRAGYEVYRKDDIVGFAAPFFRAGHVAGSVGAYLPVSRRSDDKRMIAAVCDAAAAITLKLTATDSI